MVTRLHAALDHRSSSQSAVAFGSRRTDVPILYEGNRPDSMWSYSVLRPTSSMSASADTVSAFEDVRMVSMMEGAELVWSLMQPPPIGECQSESVIEQVERTDS
jgi:hypothetical protein